MPSTCHVGSNETPSRACVWVLNAGRMRVGAARLLVDMVAHDVGQIVVEGLVGLFDGLLPACGVTALSPALLFRPRMHVRAHTSSY